MEEPKLEEDADSTATGADGAARSPTPRSTIAGLVPVAPSSSPPRSSSAQHPRSAEPHLGAMGNAPVVVGGTSAAAAGGAPASPASPASPGRVASGLLTAPLQPPKEQHSASASKDATTSPPRVNGADADHVNGGSALTTSSSGGALVGSPSRAASTSQPLDHFGGSASAEVDSTASGSLTPPPPPPKEQQAAKASKTVVNILGPNSALAPPSLNGEVVAEDEVDEDADDVKGDHAKTNASSGAAVESSTPSLDQHGSTDANKADHASLPSSSGVRISTAPAPHGPNGDNVSGSSSDTSSSGSPPLFRDGRHIDDKGKGVAEDSNTEKRLLEAQVQELSAKLQAAQKVLEKKAEDALEEECAVLLQRILLRERRAQMLEEEVAARARRSNEGLTRVRGCPPHRAAVEAIYGTDAMSDLVLPLLQCSHMSAPTPSPEERTAAPTPAPLEDDMWNKRQIIYIFNLGIAVALLFLIRSVLPDEFDGWFLAGFAAMWGLGSIGLPAGIFGTTRLEKNCSRYTAQVISLSFSLIVIYAAYLLVFVTAKADGASHSPPPPASDVRFWRIIFGIIGAIVIFGHIGSSVMGCWKGGDRDLLPK